MKEYKGRAVVKGNVTGRLLVSHYGLNVLASYSGVLTNPSAPAVCIDADNKDLYNKDLAGVILCIPQVIGSTTAGMLIQTIAALKKHPKAIIFANPIDSLALSGVLLADIWENTKIVAVDRLGEAFLDEVKDGQMAEIKEDGTIIIEDEGEGRE